MSQPSKKIFIKDIEMGFAKIPKQIPCQYLYDERGSELYNQITEHPDYYLTGSEIEILFNNKKAIAELMNKKPFNLLELGPGNGMKSQLLISQFIEDQLEFEYCPIDISPDYLETVQKLFKLQFPKLIIKPRLSDFLTGLKRLDKHKTNMVLFLGSSIGNLDALGQQCFISSLAQLLNENDLVLLGFDLLKNAHILLKAYDDSAGITRDFNLNVLTRINRELGANFNTDHFQHHATFNETNNAMESYLISKMEQVIKIKALKKTYRLYKNEVIHTESSYKFDIKQIEELAKQNHFNIVARFYDSKHYFINMLWQVSKK